MINFPDQPDIRPISDGSYRLMDNYRYQDEKISVTVPMNFEHDGASVPRLAWAFMPPDGLHRAAALIHDWLYVCKGRQDHRTFTRAEADWIFYQILRKSGVNIFQARTAYYAVRAGGWTYWN